MYHVRGVTCVVVAIPLALTLWPLFMSVRWIKRNALEWLGEDE